MEFQLVINYDSDVFFFCNLLQCIPIHFIGLTMVFLAFVQTLAFGFIEWQLPSCGPINYRIYIFLQNIIVGRGFYASKDICVIRKQRHTSNYIGHIILKR